jgi:hypothetical protein
MDNKRIIKSWNNGEIGNKIPIRPIRLLGEEDINNIKSGITRSVWKINVPVMNGDFPVILKVYHSNQTFRKYYEWKVYKELRNTLVSDFMPECYEIKIDSEKSEVWIFTQCLDVFGEKQNFYLTDLYKITLTLAKLHAATFESNKISQSIRKTIPEFQTEERNGLLENLKGCLQQAKMDRTLSQIINQNCPEIYKLIEHALNFPELMRSGQCLTHGGFHLGNICYDHGNQKIKFIDWGAATFSPCWLDLVKLVETALDAYGVKKQSKIRDQCIQIYVEEMKQQGIIFPEDSGCLYRMAYLVRVFEKELRRNLSATIRGRKPFESEETLKKISMFSKELHLI